MTFISEPFAPAERLALVMNKVRELTGYNLTLNPKMQISLIQFYECELPLEMAGFFQFALRGLIAELEVSHVRSIRPNPDVIQNFCFRVYGDFSEQFMQGTDLSVEIHMVFSVTLDHLFLAQEYKEMIGH